MNEYGKCPECGCFCENGDVTPYGIEIICRNYRCERFGQQVDILKWVKQ